MKKERVLIVDDDIDLLNLVDFNLSRKGYMTSSSLDGLDAINKIEDFKPEMVILDLMLPNMDGWKICKYLRKRKKDIKVIMLTAKAMPADRLKGLEIGADDYITKPFSVQELIIRIDKLLEKRRHDDIQRMALHDMANKMNVIGLVSDRLSRQDEILYNDRGKRDLNIIREEIGCTAELLSATRSLLNSGEVRLNTEKVNISNIIKDVAAYYKNTASFRGIGIAISVLDDSLPELELNYAAVKGVFKNIIGNAVKYSKNNGDIIVSVSMDGKDVIVSVRDYGLGIPTDELTHIFENGFRASNIKHGADGSGLGLYIVKSLLDKMGAKIAVKSKEGAGSEFIITFKKVADADPAGCHKEVEKWNQ